MKRSYIQDVQESMNRLIQYCVSDLNKPRKFSVVGLIRSIFNFNRKKKTFKQLENLFTSTTDIQYIFGTNCQVKWAPGQIKDDRLLNLYGKLIDFRNSFN